MGEKVYHSNFNDFWFFGAIGLVIAILGYFENGWGDHILIGFSLLSIVLISVLINQRQTYLKVTDNRNLVNSGFGSYFKKEVIDIYNIKYVERMPAFVWKSKNSLIVIYVEVNGQLHHSKVAERSYSSETIKEFLLELKHINPSIQ